MLCYSYCNTSSWCNYYDPGNVECPFSNIQHQVTEQKCKWCNHIKVGPMGEERCPIGCTEDNHYIR